MKIKISEMYPGEYAEVINDLSTKSYAERLKTMGLRTGKIIQLIQLDSKYNQKAVIKIDDSIIALSLNLAECIFVNPIKESYEIIRDSAIKDSLTGCYTRKHFDCVAKQELAKFYSLKIPFFLIMADIDKFKTINDNFGHSIGDLVLSKIGRLLISNIRRSDIVFRWGGEEFVILLRGATKYEATDIAERLRNKIEESVIDVFGKILKITMSFGGYGIPPASTLETLLNEADKRLYEAKKTGRNRVVLV